MTMPDDLPFEDTPNAPLWGVDGATLARWNQLQPGRDVTVVKRSSMQHGPDFRVEYPGRVVDSALPSPWVDIEARWVAGTIHQAHLTFENDDILREIFSPVHPYNAFAVYTPAGELKGWYANTVFPTTIELTSTRMHVVWDDLFIDIVATPDGDIAILDENELEDSKLSSTDPILHKRILAARDELLERFLNRQPPFSSPDRIAAPTDR